MYKLCLGRVDMVPLLPIELRYYINAIGASESEFVSITTTVQANLYFGLNIHFPRADYDRLTQAFERLQNTEAFATLPQEHYLVAKMKNAGVP